jgi:CDP-diacylglycerol---serine O-phosphatidyltransferase
MFGLNNKERFDVSTNMNPNLNPKSNSRQAIRRRRLRDRLHVNIYVLPNLLTIMNMFFGFYALIHSISGNYIQAAYAICASAVFDLLDGRVARMTRSTSEFGAQLDSLSDLVSFCLAPGVLLYLWSLQPFGRVGWLISFFYVACGALRLARFNVQKSVVSSAYFQGLPTPMAAGIVASAILAFNDLEWDASASYVILSITALLGVVMVSTFPYRSFKDIDFRHRLPFRYLVIGVFLLAVIAMRPEVMLFVTFLTYTVLGAVFGIFKLGRPPKILASPNESEHDH